MTTLIFICRFPLHYIITGAQGRDFIDRFIWPNNFSLLFQKYVSEGSTVRDCVPHCVEKGEYDNFRIARDIFCSRKKKKTLQSIFAKPFHMFFAQYLRH